MKKVTFLVAFFALLQAASGTPSFAQERFPDDSKRNVEEALELASQDIADEMEELLQQLEISAEKIGQQLERWAEDNSQELEDWSQKHAQKWEAWGNRFGQKMEQLAADQEDVWTNWAQRYEKDLGRWTNQLESNELAPEQMGQFLEQNLKSLSQMPLGQMVDQALKEGLGELSDAPWDSLEELGELAKTAFEEPLSELTEILDENSDERKAVERSVRGVGRALEEFDNALRDVPEAKVRPRVRELEDPRVRALKELRNRDDLTGQQRDRIDEMIKSIQDASHLRPVPKVRTDRPRDLEPRIDVPRTDQIKEKIEREKKRQLKQDSRLPRAEPLKETIRESDQKSKQLDARLPKRADGKNVDGSLKKPANSGRDASQRFQRDGRDGKANRKPAAETNRSSTAKSDAKAPSEIDLLREEIARLRREVQALKKESDKSDK